MWARLCLGVAGSCLLIPEAVTDAIGLAIGVGVLGGLTLFRRKGEIARIP